jgi:hypothetical protein
VTRLTHPVNGHKLTTDDASVEFWKSAGYVEAEQPPTKKAPAKKAASRKASTK